MLDTTQLTPGDLTMDSLCQGTKLQIDQTINFSTQTISSCNEEFPELYRFLYSLFTMIFQYLFPGVAIAVANGKIFRKLKTRERESFKRKSVDEAKQREDQKRMKRAKNLLVCIGAVFLMCWIPINSINLISDLLYMCNMSLLKFIGTYTFYLSFTACHFSAMICAVINPAIYGYFNENFRREFIILYRLMKPEKENKITKIRMNPIGDDNEFSREEK